MIKNSFYIKGHQGKNLTIELYNKLKTSLNFTLNFRTTAIFCLLILH